MKSLSIILTIALGLTLIQGIELFIWNNQPNINHTATPPEQSSTQTPSLELPEGADIELSDSQQLQLDLATFLARFRFLIYGTILLIISTITDLLASHKSQNLSTKPG